MKNINIFCFGFGQVAKNFIKKLEYEKLNIKLSTTSREKTMQKKIGNLSYQSFHFDGLKYDKDLVEQLNKSDHISKIINVVTGSFCLFPASLFHYTIPFKSSEERIVLAFDVIPN